MEALEALWQSVPLLIQAASVLIVLLFFSALIYLLLDARSVTTACTAFATIFVGVPPLRATERQAGTPLEVFNNLETRAGRLKGEPRRWWDALADSFVEYPPGEARTGFFLGKGPHDLLHDEPALARLYHAAFHHSVPGLLTGIGLAVTFAAILLALMGVTYDVADKLEPVKGIGGLINGLSGKFLSSIVALACAVVFTFIEKFVDRHVSIRLDATLHGLARVVPVLTTERILADVRKTTAAQAVSLSNISSDIVDRFVNAFQQELSPALASGLSTEMVQRLEPTLDRMNTTLAELKVALERIEQQKQESVTAELEGMQRAIQGTLSEMGRQFHESLSAAARDEFGSVQGTLQSTARLLGGMNTQFTELQATLSRMVDKAESATTGQLQANREQAEAMTSLMNGLMTQLQEASTSNVDAISGRLTLVVDELSRRVGALSEQMMSTIAETATASQQSAGRIIEQASSLSESSARRLDDLVKSIEARSGDFEEAGRTLVQLQAGLATTIRENQGALKALHDAATQVVSYSTALAGQSAELKNLAAQNAQLAGATNEAVGLLRSGMVEHRQLLQQHDGVLGRYDASFASLEQRLDAVLKVVLTGLQTYAQTTENNFRAIVGISNEAVPRMAQALQAQTGELQNSLEELTSVLDQGVKRLESAVDRGSPPKR